MRVWISADGRWRLEQRDGGSRPWRVELYGGLIASGATRGEVLAKLGVWLVESGEAVPEFKER